MSIYLRKMTLWLNGNILNIHNKFIPIIAKTVININAYLQMGWDKLDYVHTEEYHSAMKRNELMITDIANESQKLF